MSDLLSELYPVRIDGADFVRLVDVRMVLRDPTDEQLDAVAAAEFALRMGLSKRGFNRMPKWYRDGARDTARRWLLAAAGGDQ